MVRKATHEHSTYSTWKWWNSILVNTVVLKISKDSAEIEFFKKYVKELKNLYKDLEHCFSF